MATALRPSGISIMGAMPWGTHGCLFYETTQDLLDTVVPYCKAGLEHHEFCLWSLSASLTEEEARRALQQAVPDLDRHLAERSIAILPYDAWYPTEGAFDLYSLIQGWQEKLAQALARGYAGMRASGTPVWSHEQGGWDVRAYEQEFDGVIAQQCMLVLCTYPLAASGAADIFDVARHHQVVVARRRGQWEMVETPELKRAKEALKRFHDELEHRVMERTRQLATAYKALHRQMAERMRAEEALWERERKYRCLFELSHDVIVLLDPTGHILEINRRGAQVTGYGPVELRHMHVVHDLVLPEDQAMIRAMLADVVQGQAREYEVRWRTKTGSVVHLDGASVPHFTPRGGFLSTLCSLRDMTERKRTEEALRASEERFAKAFRSSPAMQVITRLADGRFLDVNDAFVHRFGYERAEVIGHTALALGLWVHPHERPGRMQMLHERRVVRGYETRARTKAGSILDLLVFLEGTERTQAQDMRQSFSQHVIATPEAERRRIARAFHDAIGQALTALNINVQAVQSATETAPCAPQWHDSIHTMDRALQQVRDVAFDLWPALLDDLGLVAALRWYVDREAQRAGFRAAFVTDLADTRVPAALETACFRIAQAALTNVVRHAQARQVGVELRQRGAELHLVVRDDGVGFEVSTVAHWQASEVHLGIQGMQERALLLGGQLAITSAPGRGTAVLAWFPLRSSTPPQSRESATQ
jgi:PAS domain S-box-containing protein